MRVAVAVEQEVPVERWHQEHPLPLDDSPIRNAALSLGLLGTYIAFLHPRHLWRCRKQLRPYEKSAHRHLQPSCDARHRQLNRLADSGEPNVRHRAQRCLDKSRKVVGVEPNGRVEADSSRGTATLLVAASATRATRETPRIRSMGWRHGEWMFFPDIP